MGTAYKDRGLEFILLSLALHSALLFALARDYEEPLKTITIPMCVVFENEVVEQKKIVLPSKPVLPEKKVIKTNEEKKETPKTVKQVYTREENLQPDKPQTAEQNSALPPSVQEQKIIAKEEEAKAPKETPAIFSADYLKNPHPAYPPASKRLGEEGKVFIKVEVLADGSAGETVIAQSSGFERLDKSALVSIKNWRFIPAKKGGQNIVSWVIVPIVFNLSK